MNRVRELREDRLLTQAELARKARIATRTVHAVEKGKVCRMTTQRKILEALGIPFDLRHEIFGDLHKPDAETTSPDEQVHASA
jgi:DNA-binding XRE family transcriptional regulator